MPNSLHPFVSIIMPIKNEERYIERSLRSVLAQNYPADSLEVLVVDGNSSDRTRELISYLVFMSKFPVSLLDNPTGIVPKALNIGLHHAKGDVIIRVDGHCEIQHNYVQICVDQLLDQCVECVGGAISTIGETFMAKSIALTMSTSFGVGNVAFRLNKGTTQLTDSVPFPAYPRRIFEQLGGFDEEMLCNEDDEFNYRILKNNGRILLINDLQTRYFSRGSLKSLWKQYFRYGLWKVRVMQKHPSQMRIRQFIPSIFVLTLIISAVFALVISWGWVIFAILIGIYFVAVLIASFKSVHDNNLRYLLMLPIVFLVLHISYGTGFLFGLFRFMRYFGAKP